MNLKCQSNKYLPHSIDVHRALGRQCNFICLVAQFALCLQDVSLVSFTHMLIAVYAKVV